MASTTPTQAQPMPLAAGTRLGHFEVIAPVGSGGMGDVYRARDLALGRDVALKVLPEEFAHDRGRLARFEREARAAAALNHPNILMVFEVGASGDTPYVAFELLSGQTLRHAMDRPLGVRRSARLRDRDRPRPCGRARQRRSPPGHQARESVRHHGRAREDPGFRHRETRRRRTRGRRSVHGHGAGRRDRHYRVHGPRAGARRAGRLASRRVRPWRGVLRDAHRTPGLSRQERGRSPLRNPQGRPARRDGRCPRGASRRGPRRPAVPGKTTRRTLSVRARHRVCARGCFGPESRANPRQGRVAAMGRLRDGGDRRRRSGRRASPCGTVSESTAPPRVRDTPPSTTPSLGATQLGHLRAVCISPDGTTLAFTTDSARADVPATAR